MKPLYSLFYRVILIPFALGFAGVSYGQCPPGHTETSVAYDTTISFPSGATSMIVKFPQFDPLQGMVTCMKMCITVGGVVDSLSFENNDKDNPNTYVATYNRTDFITGPGITGAMISSISRPYTFPLAPSDNVVGSVGIPNGSGPDFGSVSKDTILSSDACTNISSSLEQFYGTDSLSYTYNITGGLNISSSANATITIATSGFVRIKFSYCVCPATVLPLNIRAFTVSKIGDNQADLKWSGYDNTLDNYHYEAEVSRNAYTFTSIGTLPKNKEMDDDAYHMNYTATESGIYYFRIKQVYANGYVRYSETRMLNLENSHNNKFYVYPNPSSGIVGIKFDNSLNGQFNIQIFNAQGQVVVRKDIVVNGGYDAEVANLKSGVYWLRLTDKKSLTTCVTQLIIK